MSILMLEDGHGSGNKAKIDSSGRIRAYSVVNTDMADTSQNNGLAYAFSTNGFISLTTTGAESGIFYLKNTSTTKVLELHGMRTCGTTPQQWRLYTGDSGGTLISTANSSTPVNLNRTSTNTAEATVYYGADTLTRSGGTLMGVHSNSGHSIYDFQGSFVLGTNDSITLTAEVASAGEVCVFMTGHYVDA